ncbi:hypothetical protein Mapa_003396 [Marchantia paleacea]|nr:hypothetical protein Mapa_003396 [Marchantia paleacea]
MIMAYAETGACNLCMIKVDYGTARKGHYRRRNNVGITLGRFGPSLRELDVKTSSGVCLYSRRNSSPILDQ